MSRRRPGSHWEPSITPVLRDSLLEVLAEFRSDDSPMVGLLQSLGECLRGRSLGEAKAVVKPTSGDPSVVAPTGKWKAARKA